MHRRSLTASLSKNIAFLSSFNYKLQILEITKWPNRILQAKTVDNNEAGEHFVVMFIIFW